MAEPTPNMKILKFFATPGMDVAAKQTLLKEAQALSEADRNWFVAEIDKLNAAA